MSCVYPIYYKNAFLLLILSFYFAVSFTTENALSLLEKSHNDI